MRELEMMRKGYLTVFLSLTITVMLSLILALLESARIGAIRLKAECAADIAMNSVLAEYNRALFEQYDLLLVDCSYQTATPSIANVEGHLRYFLQGNFDRTTIGSLTGSRSMTAPACGGVHIPAYSVATDGGGAVLRRQILAYMAGEPVSEALLRANDNLETLSARGYDTHDVEAEAAANRERLDQIEIPERPEPEEGEEGWEEPEAIPDNPADKVESQKGIGVASLAVPDPSSISTTSVNLGQFTSHREKNRGTGLDESESLGLTEKLLFDQYLCEKTGNYTSPKEGSLLKYQLEYLIGGKSNDYDNLEHCGRILLFWREASNFAYLTTDAAKKAEVEALAALIALLTFCPELEEPLKWSMIFAWSFAESISDLRTLYEGGKVPLVKTSDTWHLSFGNLIDFRDYLGGGGEKGLSYEDYLRMLLLLASVDDKTDRLCDLIEMDVRRTPGNERFRLDWCLDIFEAQIEVRSRFGFTMQMMRTYGYEK